ncbi:ATP-binding protein [Desulfococcaceae bacterium HSG7]|nr:ATP-binding protein [Desulfococcaceae bacterium HSG7]
MLIDFTIKNYRSIRESITLSALATDIPEHPDNVFQSERKKNINLLKTAVIYGANAAGKSNIIKAFETFIDFVVKSTDLKLGDKLFYYDPFRLNKNSSGEPTMFEIEFLGNDSVRYRYSIQFDNDEILKESLVFFPKGYKAVLFYREKGKRIKFGDSFKGPAKTIEKQLLENHLFLSKVANSNNKLLRKIYLYFRNTLQLLVHPHEIPQDFTSELCLQNESNKKFISDFLKIADTGIEYVKIKKTTIDDNEFLDEQMSKGQKLLRKIYMNQRMKKPQMFHKVFENGKEAGSIGFDLEDESDGTQKLYDLAGKILYVLKNGLVLIADELNNSLHPLMTQVLIDLFHNPETNPENAQLIFATHDTTLLNPDSLRRDQIWLCEKDQYGATSLFSISEFDYSEVSSQTPFDKWYLSGRFGALPMIGRFEEWIKNAQKETDKQT